MRHGSLFSGIGGFDLAAQWAGFENIFQVEIDDYCQKILAKNFPKTNRHRDIKEFDGTKYTNTIDIISGGFPCQPFSVAGKQKGGEDDRNLWPEMFRVIQEIKPTWVVGENVAAIINFVEFDNLLADLEGEGFEVQTFIIPACGVDAKHRRNRVWLVAYNDSLRVERPRTEQQTTGLGRKSKTLADNTSLRWHSEAQQKMDEKTNGRKERCRFDHGGEDVGNTTIQGLQKRKKSKQQKSLQNVERGSSFTNTNGKRQQEQRPDEPEKFSFERCSRWEPEPGVGRVASGIPRRVDRLKGLGNAVVPQIPWRLFEMIKNVESL